jgi:CBS domain-containing protein
MKVKRIRGSAQAPAPQPSREPPDSRKSQRDAAAQTKRHGSTERLQAQASTSLRLCREVMSENPICCLPNDPVDVVAQVMVTEDVGSLPVVRDLQTAKLIGIVTDRDLTVNVVAEGRDPKGTSVAEAMTHEPLTCYAEDDVQRVLEIMAEHQVRRVPVVDNNGRLIGIIAQADIATRLPEPEKTAQVVEEISQSTIRSA